MNLHGLAKKIIPQYSYSYQKYQSHEVDDEGIDQPVFSYGIGGSGSVQVVPMTQYQSLGLNNKKSYIMIYTDDDLRGGKANKYGDRVNFNDSEYEVMDENDWKSISDWTGVMCVKL